MTGEFRSFFAGAAFPYLQNPQVSSGYTINGNAIAGLNGGTFFNESTQLGLDALDTSFNSHLYAAEGLLSVAPSRRSPSAQSA
jgi:hypothetical protein